LHEFSCWPEGRKGGIIHSPYQLPIGLLMFHLISWFLTLTLLAAWSTGVWMLHGLAAWSMTGAGALMAQSQKIDAFNLPAWTAQWIPPDLMLAVKASAATVLPWLETALAALPSPVGWLSPLAWTVWGVGSVILVVCAVLMHILISVTRNAARR
jgi:hypothetical protein